MRSVFGIRCSMYSCALCMQRKIIFSLKFHVVCDYYYMSPKIFFFFSLHSSLNFLLFTFHPFLFILFIFDRALRFFLTRRFLSRLYVHSFIIIIIIESLLAHTNLNKKLCVVCTLSTRRTLTKHKLFVFSSFVSNKLRFFSSLGWIG